MRFGRRTALAIAMFLNALFALLSAGATSFGTLALCRVMAGVGVSGRALQSSSFQLDVSTFHG